MNAAANLLGRIVASLVVVLLMPVLAMAAMIELLVRLWAARRR